MSLTYNTKPAMYPTLGDYYFQGSTMFIFDGMSYKAVVGMSGPCGPMGMQGDKGDPGEMRPETTLYGSNGNSITVGEMVDTIVAIQERERILAEDIKKHERFPELKSLYDQYKVMERLLLSGGDNPREEE